MGKIKERLGKVEVELEGKDLLGLIFSESTNEENIVKIESMHSAFFLAADGIIEKHAPHLKQKWNAMSVDGKIVITLYGEVPNVSKM